MNFKIVAGMAFGDEGKGKTVDYLAARYNSPLVVRYNGGPQAAHNVVTPEGKHHTFAQVGSGSFAGADTHLSRFMLIDPVGLVVEVESLVKKLGKAPFVSIDPGATVIFKIHRQANKLREYLRGVAVRHGTTGHGVGEARYDEICGVGLTVGDFLLGADYARDKYLELCRQRLKELTAPTTSDWWGLFHRSTTTDDLLEDFYKVQRALRVFPKTTLTELLRELPDRGNQTVVFEGAQGFLLDENFGFAPHVTWTNCTFANALTLIREAQESIPSLGQIDVEKIGVFRTYFTRHGAGPFPTEREFVTVTEPHNSKNEWMGHFRVGEFDRRLAAYALGKTRPDSLMFTHFDVMLPGGYYPGLGSKVSVFNEEVKTEIDGLGIPVARISFGPTREEVNSMEDNL